MKYKIIGIVLSTWVSCLSNLAGAQAAPASTVAEIGTAKQGTESHNDNRPPCLDRFAVVNEVSPFVGLNDFNGISQTVEAIGYARSECIGSSDTRWRLEANVAHVGQKGYSAESALLGVGVEIHPFIKAPDLVVVPVVRLGYERIPSGNDNLVWGGAVTAENVWTLNFITRDVATTTAIVPGTQFVAAARAEYTNRSAVNVRIPAQAPLKDQLNFFGLVGLDGPFKGGRWRWRSSGSYQSIDGGSINGYASFAFSVRHLDETFENYRWNYQIIGNVGDHNYRGLLINISYRFTQRRGAAQ
jgi:hypothetical protein